MASDKLIFRQKCYSQQRLTQKTLIAMLPEGSKQREWFEALDTEKWSITSFDSRTREACVDVQTDTGVNHVSVLLPYIDVTATDSP